MDSQQDSWLQEDGKGLENGARSVLDGEKQAQGG